MSTSRWTMRATDALEVDLANPRVLGVGAASVDRACSDLMHSSSAGSVLPSGGRGLMQRWDQPGRLAVAVVCLPDRGGDALVAYRLEDQANGRRWVDADVEVLVDHRHATPRPGRGGRPSGQVASDGPFDLPDPGAL